MNDKSIIGNIEKVLPQDGVMKSSMTLLVQVRTIDISFSSGVSKEVTNMHTALIIYSEASKKDALGLSIGDEVALRGNDCTQQMVNVNDTEVHLNILMATYFKVFRKKRKSTKNIKRSEAFLSSSDLQKSMSNLINGL